ncbi:MAG: transporter substrate-binding domain-containing protein [bacterium]
MPSNLKLVKKKTFSLLFVAVTALSSMAQETAPHHPQQTSPLAKSTAPFSQKLHIAVHDRPPFSFKGEDGQWIGLSLDLWHQIAEELHLTFELVEVPLIETAAKLHSGELDIDINSVLTAENAKLVDYMVPYFFSHGGAATKDRGFFQNFSVLFSHMKQGGLFEILLIMIGALLFFSSVLSLLEWRREKSHIRGPKHHKFGHALWYSAITMAGGGFEDVPLSVIGRILTFVWLFFSISMVAFFTGIVVTSMSSIDQESGMMKIAELSQFHNGVYKGSHMEEKLSSIGIPAKSYASAEEGLDALALGRINAFSADAATLHYLILRDYPGQFKVAMIPSVLYNTAFATRPNFPLTNPIESRLIEITEEPQWTHRVERWLGPLVF